MSIPSFVPPLISDFKSPFNSILSDIKGALNRWPRMEIKYHEPKNNIPFVGMYINNEKTIPTVWPGHKDFAFPQKPVGIDLNPAVDEVAKKVAEVFEINFSFPKKDFLDLRKIVDLPVYDFLPKLEPQGFQKALQNFFNKPHNVSVSDHLSRYLSHIENRTQIPLEIQSDLKLIQKKLQFYSAIHCPSQEQLQRELDYYHFDLERFSEKVLNSFSGEQLAYFSKEYQERQIARRAEELAPIHPALHRYLPSVLIKEQRSALAMTGLIEGAQQKIALLEQEGKLHLLKCGPELQEMLEVGAVKSGEWVFETVKELVYEMEGIKEKDLKERLELLEAKIVHGATYLRSEVQENGVDKDSAWRQMGKAIFGKAFLLRGPFDLLASFSPSPYNQNKIDWDEVLAKGVKLPHIEGAEPMLGNFASYTLSIDSDSAFTGEDFNNPSSLLTIHGQPLSKGKAFFVNGIANSLSNADASAKIMAKLSGGIEITGIYNGSQGVWADLQECFLHYNFNSTEPVKQLVDQIISYFEDHDEEHQILITCHSQGALITRNALIQLPPHIRNRISIVAVAPAAYIDRNLCGAVVHLVSKWDWLIPQIDRAGRERCKDTTIVLERKGWSLLDPFDHSFESKTYTDLIRKVNRGFAIENK